ncbi:SDR family NAD(P)-dependent oxidoreductase [bacterium]|nr:SDR family NAD(P)-dependent oxidoreductase [bacterium]
MRMSGQTVLVTGATSGIGFELTLKLATLQNQVIAVGRDPRQLDKLADVRNVQAIRADLSDMTDIEMLVMRVQKEYSALNILVNNAGVQFNYQFPAEASPLSKIELETTINFLAPVRLTTLMLPHLMVQPSAAIVNVTSFLAQVPKQDAAIYCATKAALRSFSKSLRYQLEESIVQVLEVIPPVVDTPMTRGRDSKKISAEMVSEEMIRALEHGKEEVYIGPVRTAKRLARFFPGVIERKIRHS